MMRFGSGTYNVRDSEIVRDAGRQIYRTIICTVAFLDSTEHEFELDRHARGQDLLDKVFEHLELIEKDYFGLQFIDAPLEQPDNRRWLEPSKSIRKQMEYPPFMLRFRVKFYVSDPSKLLEEYTRYHFYMQLRKDILEGRLQMPESSEALLGSYAVQSEFGDYCPEEQGDNYLDGFQFVPNQTASVTRKFIELHKLHLGQTPADAEFNFLDHAKRLEMYGVDPYHARDSQQTPIELGVTSHGVVVFQNGKKINTFSWGKIVKLSFKRKQFFISLKSEEDVETIVGFNLSTTRTCKLLWKTCIEHHTFFRLIAPPQPPPKTLFTLGSRYRYSGRTEYQTLEEMKRRAKIERTFHRAGSKSSYARSTIGPSTVGSFRNLPSPIASIPGSEMGTPLASPHMNGRLPELHNGSVFIRNYQTVQATRVVGGTGVSSRVMQGESHLSSSWTPSGTASPSASLTRPPRHALPSANPSHSTTVGGKRATFDDNYVVASLTPVAIPS